MKRWAIAALCIYLLATSSCMNIVTAADDTTDIDLLSMFGILGNIVNGVTAPTGGTCASATFGTCASALQTKNFSACTKGSSPDTLTVNGTISLIFGPACPVSYPPTSPGSTENRTFIGQYFTNSSGRNVIMYTNNDNFILSNNTVTVSGSDLRDFNGIERSGGSQVIFTNSTTRSVNISGIHRRSIYSNGALGFWHTMYTTSNISAAISGGGVTKTLTGSFIVTHNRSSITMTSSFSSLQYDSGCNFPVGGTATILIETLTGVTRNLSATFTGVCGDVDITESSITSTLTLVGGI